jgi:beta-fructofuranosidase
VTARPPRPCVHFTARRGWINDPLGLTHHDGTYHLFFQYVPGQTDWAPTCQWGHATSTDLMHWTEQAPAIVPGNGEDGCWSGSLVGAADGGPVIFYTSVSLSDVGVGSVKRAHPVDPGWRVWDKDAQAIVTLPADVTATTFRDPYVFRDGDQWRMLVGAGLADGTATALHYSSTDLRAWTYDGQLAARSTRETEPVWTGSMWECPQLLRLGSRDVLVVSAWDAKQLHHVAYAVGHYADGRFDVERWDQLSHGPSYYAASSFVDEHGRQGLIYWLRDVGDPSGGWMGALSIPHVLEMVDGRLRSAPHPALAARRRATAGHPVVAFDVEWSPLPGGTLQLLEGTDRVVARLHHTSRGASGELALDRPGHDVEGTCHVPYSHGPVRVVVDGPVLEVFTDRGVLAAGLVPAPHGVRPAVSDGGGELRWWPLD